MDTERIQIFTDAIQEQTCIQLVPACLDLTDSPLTPPQILAIAQNPNLYVTSPVTQHGYFELDFNLANNYWGINMNFGNDPNGVQLRQGIAHLINKTSFTANDASIAGISSPNDNPIPLNSSFAGTVLTTPNPCGWDTLFPQSGSQCVNGSKGGTAYNCRIGAACPSGTLGLVPPHAWQAQIGSADFCAAATHFRDALNNGVLTSSKGVHLNANCELLAPGQSTVMVGWPSNVTQNAPNIFVRFDDPARLDLGLGYAQEICALWTGNYTTGCPQFFSMTQGPITSFCGFLNSPNGLNRCWWMYTAGFRDIFPFDDSLYFGYNSKFVSGGPFDHPPCASTTPSSTPNNYMYLCNASYDTASSQMEFASNLSAAFTSATSAMNVFGQGAYTIPVWTGSDRFGYLNNWQRVINGDGVGIPNFFTWLDARTATLSSDCSNSPPLSTGLCIRQGFSQTTRSLNPYIASTTHDFYVLNNIYDRLMVPNPASNGQLLDWMVIRDQQNIPNNALTYTPPAGTTTTIRFTLRPDIFWHDGQRLTSWDVKFSYLTLNATGAFQGSVLSPMTGVTVLGPTQLDLNLRSSGPFTEFTATTPTVLPGRYWSGNCAGSAWDNYVRSGTVPDNCISVDPTKLALTFDPINAGILIGSGAYRCISTGVSTPPGTLGSGCSSTGLQNPPIGGSYTLTRNGLGFAPGSSPQGAYFRSSGTLAIYIWTQNTGDAIGDPINFSIVASCIGRTDLFSNCDHFKLGICGSGGGPVAGIQASCVLRFIFVQWASPFNLTTNPPIGMAIPPTPVLYEGSVTLNPARLVGCGIPQPAPTQGYDC
jgi:hypothetical protein